MPIFYAQAQGVVALCSRNPALRRLYTQSVGLILPSVFRTTSQGQAQSSRQSQSLRNHLSSQPQQAQSLPVQQSKTKHLVQAAWQRMDYRR
jgi:hypothetical protein